MSGERAGITRNQQDQSIQESFLKDGSMSIGLDRDISSEGTAAITIYDAEGGVIEQREYDANGTLVYE